MMNYPSGIKKQMTHTVNYSHRGMTLEEDLNQTNLYYREHDIAYIYKKPTPIKITKVVFNAQKSATIKEAFFMEPSTTDYNGIYKGYYIDFEAKETKNKTSFPLANIHPHQLQHLKHILAQGGIGFIVVRFTTLQKTFLLNGEQLFSFLNNSTSKSIPLSYFLEQGWQLTEKFSPRLDYLKIIDHILEVNKNEKSKEKHD